VTLTANPTPAVVADTHVALGVVGAPAGPLARGSFPAPPCRVHPRGIPVSARSPCHPPVPRRSPPLVRILVGLSRRLLPRRILCPSPTWPRQSQIATAAGKQLTTTQTRYWLIGPKHGPRVRAFSHPAIRPLLTSYPSGGPHPWPLHPRHRLEGRRTCPRIARLSRSPLR